MKGKIKIILLPGFDGTGILFEPFLKLCPSKYIPIVIKYPVNESLSYTALEKLVMLEIPKDENFIIIGESFSGPVAVRISARRSPNLLAVVLVASFISSPVSTWLKFIPFDYLSKVPIPYLVLKYWLLNNARDSELSYMLQRAVKKLNSNVIATRIRSILNVDESDSLRKISVPVLYLRAIQDRLVHKKSYRIIKEVKPDIKLSELEAPHLLLQVQPMKAWQEIASFTNRVGAL